MLFVAANWQAFGVFGRFALLQIGLLACVAVALWRAPPALAGRGASIFATLLTGGMLALFGQSYQTGADLYELFFVWAALGLPFALAGLSGALWALWWAVLNVGLALLCGGGGTDLPLWRLADGGGLDRSALLMLPCLIDLFGADVFLWLGGTRFAVAAPGWLVRGLASAGFLFGTLAMLALWIDPWRISPQTEPSAQHVGVALVFTGVSAVIAVATWRARRDVFAMALIGASWIVISTTWLARSLRFDDLGAFLAIALWLIAASTATGKLLMHWLRAWRPASINVHERAAA